MSLITDIEIPCLLLALPKLVDPNFHKTVVLLVEHNSEGAMGFVVNRPSGVPLKDLLKNHDLNIPSKIPAWYGGPINTSNGLVLHNHPTNEESDDSCANYGEEIAVSSSKDSLKSLVEYTKLLEKYRENDMATNQSCGEQVQCSQALYPYRFVVGYAGWGAKQLDEEIKEGAWLQIPMDTNLIFFTPWQNIWENALKKIGVNPADIISQNSSYVN